MSKDQLQEIMDILKENDYVFQMDYSGRFMYGDECLAVELDSMERLFALGTVLYEYANQLGVVKLDQLGLSYIAYFPKVVTNHNET